MNKLIWHIKVTTKLQNYQILDILLYSIQSTLTSFLCFLFLPAILPRLSFSPSFTLMSICFPCDKRGPDTLTAAVQWCLHCTLLSPWCPHYTRLSPWCPCYTLLSQWARRKRAALSLALSQMGSRTIKRTLGMFCSMRKQIELRTLQKLLCS